MNQPQHSICPVCHRSCPDSQMIAIELIAPDVLARIKQDHHITYAVDKICLKDLSSYQTRHIHEHIRLKAEPQPSTQAENQDDISNDFLSKNINETFYKKLSVGDRIADSMASFGGSWPFILIFLAILLTWIMLNSIPNFKVFDPYPFILLNLVLSCLAAIQAPIIMMSQNRQEQKDRLRAEQDYQVNLQAELEIRHLQSKLDYLFNKQWHLTVQIDSLLRERNQAPIDSRRCGNDNAQE